MSSLVRRLLFLPEQASSFAPRADALHATIIGAALLAATAVGVVGLFFLVRYRRRAPAELTPHIEAPVWLEGLFAGIPLACFLVWGGIGVGDFVWAGQPPPGALEVYVMGKQWMWKFAYPEGPDSIGVLHVPAGRPVRLLLTSRDVIHSFYVPDFRLKRDVVPGRYTELWFEAPRPGRHQVLCAEYCGLDHSQMRGEVVVLEPAEFEALRRRGRQRLPPLAEGGAPELTGESMAARGEEVAARAGCLRCHSVDGTPHIGPTWLGLYGRREPLAGGGTVVADEAYLTESMMLPQAKVVAGYLPVMPSFQGTLSAGEVGSLVEYIKSLRPPGPGTPGAQEPAYAPVRR